VAIFVNSLSLVDNCRSNEVSVQNSGPIRKTFYINTQRFHVDVVYFHVFVFFKYL